MLRSDENLLKKHTCAKAYPPVINFALTSSRLVNKQSG